MQTWNIHKNMRKLFIMMKSYLIRAITRRNHTPLWQSPAQINKIRVRCLCLCVFVFVSVSLCVYLVMLNCCRSLRQSEKYLIGELSPSTQAAHTPCLSHSIFLHAHSMYNTLITLMTRSTHNTYITHNQYNTYSTHDTRITLINMYGTHSTKKQTCTHKHNLHIAQHFHGY